MSKQSEAKKKQGYQDKPLQRRCRVCAYLETTTYKKDWGGIGEKLRCRLGGFAVKANAICDRFELKD